MESDEETITHRWQEPQGPKDMAGREIAAAKRNRYRRSICGHCAYWNPQSRAGTTPLKGRWAREFLQLGRLA